ncbi:hypothetical protein MN202_19555 [Rheinheimera muenzenbergensis]|uniref:Uncharacterized protein n=1 Tax=Rheinheimera muenzenbergensis TaxID=1193628 RepID=A0ABU8CBS0_9GAMM
MFTRHAGLTAFIRKYGGPAVLALLLHALLLAAVLTTDFPVALKEPPAVPIVSYLYQPPQPVAVEQPPQPLAEMATAVEAVQPVTTNAASPAAVTEPPAEQRLPARQQSSAESLADTAARPEPEGDRHAAASPQQSLAQRALNRAATVNPAAIEQAAAASYQQLLQAQQQPKLTVEKRHQQLTEDPAGQVIVKLDDGRQIVRTKGGCRIADPTKDGFDALMAARPVPCGDEEHSSALLKQALEKHRKR